MDAVKHYFPAIGGTYYVTSRSRRTGGYAVVEAVAERGAFGLMVRCRIIAQTKHGTATERAPGDVVWTRLKNNIWSRRSPSRVAAMLASEREALFAGDCA